MTTAPVSPFSLTGKTILVSGASSGIGRAIAVECSRQGARLVLTARSRERLEQTMSMLHGSGHSCIMADLCNDADIKRLIKESPALDGLVACVGVGSALPTQFATHDKLMQVFGPNFFAPVELVRQAQKGKKITSGGSVVFISSIGGTSRFTNGGALYGASKAALSSWMKILALELAPKKIRVNAICPGMTLTPMIAPTETLSQEDLDKDAALYPLKRYGNPEEIGYAAVYFLSDATAWVTGTNFIIDGGISLT